MIPPRILANLDQFGYLYAFAATLFALAWAPSVPRFVRSLSRRVTSWH